RCVTTGTRTARPGATPGRSASTGARGAPAPAAAPRSGASCSRGARPSSAPAASRTRMAETTGAPRLRGLARTFARAHVLLLAAALLPSLAPTPLRAQTGPEPSPGERLPVREVTLDNGMRFLILPPPGAPAVSFVLQFGIGGIREPPGRTGLAHLVEHMLFKGTTTVGTNDLEAERRLFALMDAAHDSVLDARAAGDTLRA